MNNLPDDKKECNVRNVGHKVGHKKYRRKYTCQLGVKYSTITNLN